MAFSNFVSANGVAATDQAAAARVSFFGGDPRARAESGVEVTPDAKLLRPVAPGRFLIAVEDEEGRPVAAAKVTRLETAQVCVAAAPDGSTEVFRPFARDEMVTDAKGEIEFDAGDRGNRFELLIEVPGYAAKHYRLRDPGKRYALRLHRSASISGKVTDIARRPLAGITVELWHDISRRVATVTDENGLYEFRDVTPTSATLRIQEPGFIRARQHVVEVEERIQYFRDFVLERGRHLEVVVQDPQGLPLGGAEVRLIELQSGLVCGVVATDQSGRVAFDCLQPELHYLAVAHTGTEGGRVLVTALAEQESGSVAILARPLWTYQGVVRTADGLPLEGTQIVFESGALGAYSSTSKEQFIVVTDAEGHFVVTGLDPALDYAALIYHQQFAMQQIADITAPEPTEGEPGAELPIQPEAPAESGNEEQIVLAPASALDGLAVDADGQPLADTVVYLSNEDDVLRALPGGQISVRTDADGRFYIGNIGSGRYFFEAHHLSSGVASQPMTLDFGAGETLQQSFLLELR